LGWFLESSTVTATSKPSNGDVPVSTVLPSALLLTTVCPSASITDHIAPNGVSFTSGERSFTAFIASVAPRPSSVSFHMAKSANTRISFSACPFARVPLSICRIAGR